MDRSTLWRLGRALLLGMAIIAGTSTLAATVPMPGAVVRIAEATVLNKDDNKKDNKKDKSQSEDDDEDQDDDEDGAHDQLSSTIRRIGAGPGSRGTITHPLSQRSNCDVRRMMRGVPPAGTTGPSAGCPVEPRRS